MIHQYKSNGYNIVMDVESGAVHVVDDVTYDVIALFEDTETSKIVEQLSDKYDKADIEEAISEVNQLRKMDSCLLKIFISLLLKNSKIRDRQL